MDMHIVVGPGRENRWTGQKGSRAERDGQESSQ